MISSQEQELRDRNLAIQLQYGGIEEPQPQISMAERFRGGLNAMGNIWITNIPVREQHHSPVEPTPSLAQQYSNFFTTSVKNTNIPDNSITSVSGTGIEGGRFRTETPMISNRTTDITSISGTGIEGGRFRTETPMISNRTTDDNILARALQAMEFEISSETLARREAREVEIREFESGGFSQKELSASGCKGQIFTLSTFICLLQIAYLIAMIQQDGFAPSAINPMIGPPATTLVRYGAKYAGLIVYDRQWWRLISPIAVHAGIIHLISNVVIQLRVGGYLNLVYGTWKWFTIYLLSGIYGEIMSCIVLPNSVGVGSSGSVLGMLASWSIWILFRWKKIPESCKKQRNCQMMVVVFSVVITLATSAAPYVDWGAHVGGAIMGWLLGIALLSSELDNKRHAVTATVISASIAVALFISNIYYIAVLLHPSDALIQVFKNNDDWHSHKTQT